METNTKNINKASLVKLWCPIVKGNSNEDEFTFKGILSDTSVDRDGEKISEALKDRKITQAMDWQFNDIFKELSFDVYWGKAITKHGSVLATTGDEYQSLKSSLREGY